MIKIVLFILHNNVKSVFVKHHVLGKIIESLVGHCKGQKMFCESIMQRKMHTNASASCIDENLQARLVCGHTGIQTNIPTDSLTDALVDGHEIIHLPALFESSVILKDMVI